MAITAVAAARAVPTHERDEDERDEDETIWLEQIHAAAASINGMLTERREKLRLVTLEYEDVYLLLGPDEVTGLSSLRPSR